MEKKIKRSDCAKRFLSCVLFVALLGLVFVRSTYLMRPTYENRTNVVGIKNEDVDMVYIGGSCAYTYWQPLKAWRDCGMTSYLYSYNALFAEGVRYYIDEAESRCGAKVYVIDARTFQLWDEAGDHRLRWGLDGMDVLSPNRWAIIREYWTARDVSQMDELSTYYFDIIKYHTMTENLALPLAWELSDNELRSPYKGMSWRSKWAYNARPKDYETDERAQLHPTLCALLIDLLEHCRERGITLQFVVPPYYVKEGHQKTYNALADIVTAYGFDFLNTNSESCYDEIGLDFSTDLCDQRHANIFGGEKYTAYLEKYLAQRYDLPDHSGDPAYGAWDEDYEAFAKEGETYAAAVRKKIAAAREGLAVAEQMQKTNDVYEWDAWAFGDDRFTLLFAQKGIQDVADAAQLELMQKWGFSPDGGGCVRARCGGEEIFAGKGEDASYSGLIGQRDTGLFVEYELSAADGEASILVDGEQYSPNENGINVVVIDNDYRRVVDVLAVVCEDGRLTIRR